MKASGTARRSWGLSSGADTFRRVLEACHVAWKHFGGSVDAFVERYRLSIPGTQVSVFTVVCKRDLTQSEFWIALIF
jgi:menaquinone-dependent protoporphyrinogen IX oxidase